MPKGGHPASYGFLNGDTLSVITLETSQVIAQIAISP